MQKIKVKIGEFIQDHLNNIVKECERDKSELLELQTKEYSKNYLGLNASFPFLKKVKEIDKKDDNRYWKKELTINNEKYRACSQFGGSKEMDGKTRSQREGEKFLHYLKNKNILLEKYAADYIKFIVGDNQLVPPSPPAPKNNIIKNIILYGAPGVGKTHNTNKLIRLIEDGKSDKEIFDDIKANENSSMVDISDIKDRVKFVTFHQSFGYEDFIEGFRPNEDGDIELVDGIFKNISMVAEKNLKDSSKSATEIEQNLDLLSIFKNYVNYKIEEAEPIKLKKGGEFYFTKFENDKLFFNTTQDSNHFQNFVLTFDDFQKIYNSDIDKNTLQDISDILGTNSIQQKYAYILAIYKDFINKKDKFSNDSRREDDITKRKNYYLVIDEINRGNISKIFGELITLIEEDKRDVLEVTLPYSKKPFRVPSNLYIIGTMNSTDKSIALIDIALRRRFTFLKMEPKADFIDDEVARKIFVKLNDKIKDDLGEDYQLGHSYFMNIQNSEDLEFALEYKIIPLLEEYYYGDDRLGDTVSICKL